MRDESLSPPHFRLGFGMLRIDAERSEHREAIRDALIGGVDLFDLGDFAADPAHFQSRAKLLLGLIAEYARNASQKPTSLIVRGNLGSAEKILPVLESLADGAMSKKIEWIYLVADPEFALASLDWDQSRLYTLLSLELDTLENLARRGALASYGVGSAALTYPKESPDALALEPLLFGRENLGWDSTTKAATRPESRAHFDWIEFPFNLYESAAATEENQSVGTRNETLLAAAREWGLKSMARRPLDAITESGLRRLVAYPDHHRVDLDEAVRLTLETALKAETETLAKSNRSRADAGVAATELDPLWAHRLHEQLRHVSDPEQWKEILRRRIDPDVARLRATEGYDSPAHANYFDAMAALMLAVRIWCEKAAAERNERIRCRIVEAAPSLARNRLCEDRDLALLAFRIYRSVPGLDAVLVGMRSPSYVQDFVKTQAALSPADMLTEDELHSTFVAVHAAIQEESQ